MSKKVEDNSMLMGYLLENLNQEDIIEARELAKISTQISQIRIGKNMNQEQFATYLGVSQGMVSRWESDDYNFTIKTLAKLSVKLDLKLEISLKSTEDKYCNVRNFNKSKWQGTQNAPIRLGEAS